ncbi:hypothetical protein [Pseudomonas aeruginosa]|uniref:hypothetical protein n=1 Tax=Pseudomonas aeruginosa TaxID=287 RepID=UPI00068C4A00|nr:hypothetical protein [Pseudomonas aeruginosa]
MSKVQRFWCDEARNIRCVREDDFDALEAEAQALREEVAKLTQYNKSLNEENTRLLVDCEETDKEVVVLRTKLAMAEDAAAKGYAARQQCGGMEMEIQELRAELAALRARVVVPDGYALVPIEPTVAMRMPWKTMRGHSWYSKYKAMLEAAPRLNGKTVSASALDTLRRFATGEVGHLNNGHCPDDLEGRSARDPNCSVCRALIDTEKSK